MTMDLKQIGKITREYFETTLNTKAFQIEIASSRFDEENKTWEIEITVSPFYGQSKLYAMVIEDESGDITGIELLEDE